MIENQEMPGVETIRVGPEGRSLPPAGFACGVKWETEGVLPVSEVKRDGPESTRVSKAREIQGEIY